MSALLIRNATILPMDDDMRVVHGSIAIRDGRIEAVGDTPEGPYDKTVDARGGFVLPGFIQTHIHLCQTLFRGYADDMPLLEWLRKRVWPMEAAHSPSSLRASVRLAAAELLRTGTTCVLSMETVHDTDVVFETLAEIGLRATVGKCMMDSDAEAPPRLREDTRASIAESLALQKRWHGAANGRLRAAFAPRFAVSCSRELLEAVAALSKSGGALVHTHASENRDEIEVVRRLSGGLSNLEYLDRTGLASPRLCTAHCVWVTETEQGLLAERGVKVTHCPGSNLKLGSGIAPVVQMRRRGICVSLGTDGAACNNRLDMFDEMRLAATLQAAQLHPGALPARDVLRMATCDGARAIGLADEIGSLQPGKRADLILVSRDAAHMWPAADPWSTLVYTARGSDVRLVLVDGRMLLEDFELTALDRSEVVAQAAEAASALAARAGLM